jgi:long-chain acyl-CoA synthetase
MSIERGSLVSILDRAAQGGGGLEQWSQILERRKRYSYGEVKEASERLGLLLQERGVKPGDRVVIWGTESPQWAMSFFGALRIGAIAVPFDRDGDMDFLGKVNEATDPQVIIAGPGQRKKLPQGFDIPILEMEKAHEIHGQEGTGLPDVDISAGDIAEIVYTSGSTGNPKGVVLTHGNITSNVEELGKIISLSNARMLSILPASHMFEQNNGLIAPMDQGVTVVYIDGLLRSDRLKQAMVDEQITGMVVVPDILRSFMESIKKEARDTGKQTGLQIINNYGEHLPMGLRRRLAHEIIEKMGGKFEFFIVGGATLDPKLPRFFESIGIKVLQGYGMTEASPVISCDRMNDRNHKPGYVGRVVPGVKVKITPDGEIAVSGPSIFPRYYNNPDKTAEVFDKDGSYHTGDAGFLEGDRLRLQGRMEGDIVVLSNGMNVHTADVLQHLLGQNEDLRDAVILGINGELHAVLLPGEEMDPKTVLQKANKGFPPYMRIRYCTVWPDDDFPRTPNKKVSIKEIQKRLRDM